MKSMLLTAIAFTSCAVLVAQADETNLDPGLSGVWFGTYENESSSGIGRRLPTFYVLDLRVSGQEVEGTFATGSGADMRTARERAMDSLGFPGNAGPRVPREQPIAGVVDGEALAVETTSLGNRRYAITAKLNRSRLRAEVTTGQDVRVVFLRRCSPSKDAADDDCALDALWAQYLESTSRRTPTAPTSEQIQSIVKPYGDSPGGQ